MNHVYDNQERERILKARESFSGRLLTDSQFDEAVAITGIMEREIRKSGTFRNKLEDYAFTFSRTEKFDALKAADAIRDLFKARTGKTMNQMREGFINREAKLLGRDAKISRDGKTQEAIKAQLSKAEKNHIYQAAKEVGQMIEKGDKINFNRAYAHQAAELAQDFKITEAGAKILMKEQFKQTENREFYEWGKEQEDKYYRPQIKAEQASREAAKEKDHPSEIKRAPSRSR